MHVNFRTFFALGLSVAAALLAACGGGAGSARSGNPLPPATVSSAAPGLLSASVSGTVVDRDAERPLSGVSVALEPWTPSATPLPEGTTAPDGTFAFTAQPGEYLLIVGSDSQRDSRATVHDNVTLGAGTNPLKAPNAPPMANLKNPFTGQIYSVPQPASETSGDYRLMTLDPATQAPCVQAVDAQRAALGLAPLVPDEWLEENAYEVNQAQNALNMGGGFGESYVTRHEDAANGPASCADWVTADFNPAFKAVWSLYPMATSTGALWYGGAFTVFANAAYENIGEEEWGYDPRIDTACPAGTPMPAPSDTLGPCDPVWTVWP